MNQSHVDRLCTDRSRSMTKTVEVQASPRKATSFVDQYIANHGEWIHKLKARDSTGRWAYYFVLVKPPKEKAFLAALDSIQTLDLADYGEVIASCYGESPTDKVKAELHERYGFCV